MIAVTMRCPERDVTFQEPHWSAARDLIRTLEGMGWAFVGMDGPAQNWDDGIPHAIPEDEGEDDAIRREILEEKATHPIPGIPTDDQIMLALGQIDPFMALTYKKIVIDQKTKPPFDPITAGWIGCQECSGVGHWMVSGVVGKQMVYGQKHECAACDGLGIVVGPPEDGLEIVGKHLPPMLKDWAIKRANKHPMRGVT